MTRAGLAFGTQGSGYIPKPGFNFRNFQTGLDFHFRNRQLTPMKLVLSAHNVTLTKAIEDHILAKLEKLEHLDHRAISARITLENDTAKMTEQRFKCSVRLDVAGPDLYAEDWEIDLYTAIDAVMKKIEQQIRKRHNKFKARNHSDAARGKLRRQEAEM
jgi:putative sigma-54 modulation protein